MIHFQLVSVKGTKFDGDVYEVLVPTREGTIAVFEDHMPIISAGQPGMISVRKKASDRENDLEHFVVNGGIVEVDGKNLRFLSDDVTTTNEVSEKEAEAALARAEEMIKNAGSQLALEEAHRLLHHSRAQLNLARIKTRHHQ